MSKNKRESKNSNIITELFTELQIHYNRYIYSKLNHIRGFTRGKKILEKLALAKVDDIKEQKDPFEEEWDNLIIIDSCRQDFWREETGMEGYRYSKGSATPEYIRKNFSD
jgi:hypothetical protein